MTREQLNAAVMIAQDPTVRFINDEGQHMEDISMFDGFGLDGFKPIICTLRQLAFLIRWQCCYIFGGGMDQNALTEIATAGRHKFNVFGSYVTVVEANASMRTIRTIT